MTGTRSATDSSPRGVRNVTFSRTSPSRISPGSVERIDGALGTDVDEIRRAGDVQAGHGPVVRMPQFVLEHLLACGWLERDAIERERAEEEPFAGPVGRLVGDQECGEHGPGQPNL